MTRWERLRQEYIDYALKNRDKELFRKVADPIHGIGYVKARHVNMARMVIDVLYERGLKK